MKLATVALALLLFPVAAAAQGPVAPVTVEPMPWVVADVRVGWPGIGNDEITAVAIGRQATDLPGRALTAAAGLHVYPLRRGRWKLGVGAELLRGRGSYQKKDTEGKPVGSEINRTLNSVSWQVSLNFGRGQGWSYLTAGTGPFAFETFLDDGPGDDEGGNTINVGGGARWFKWKHAGFTADMRFYLTRASAGTLLVAPRGGKRIVVLSVGLTVK
jgi:Outer membrane protein beta-barrel domain